MIDVRAEQSGDEAAIAPVHRAAFARDDTDGEPPEVRLVEALRASDAWIPELSIVAVDEGTIVGHVVTTRAHVEDRQALGLGPIGVLPDRQRRGIGGRLIEATVTAANALEEPLIALLGSTEYYPRFGFVPAAALGIESPDPDWHHHFQALPLKAYRPLPGRFRYPDAFDAM